MARAPYNVHVFSLSVHRWPNGCFFIYPATESACLAKLNLGTMKGRDSPSFQMLPRPGNSCCGSERSSEECGDRNGTGGALKADVTDGYGNPAIGAGSRRSERR